ncbi:MAG TPA: hypothetical protein VNM45_13995 [Bacillus sp. (in: firmicutes)]|nr:hypothetical protein [Bacillus sp. (in: firmicutes)]
MENKFRRIYDWLAFFLLSLSITCNFLDVSISDSPYLIFYGLGFLGLIISFVGRRMKLKTEGSITRFAGEIGFYGNLAIVILFFPPIYHIWGTLIFGP